MLANLSDIVKIPVAMLLGGLIIFLMMFFHYEGLRLFGWQAIDGRIEAERKEARADLVSASDLAAAKAQAEKLQKDLAKAEALRLMAERNIQSLMQQDKDDAKDLAARNAADDGTDGARYTATDIERMSKRRSRTR